MVAQARARIPQTLEPGEARAISAADMSLVLLRSLVAEEATRHVFTLHAAIGGAGCFVCGIGKSQRARSK